MDQDWHYSYPRAVVSASGFLAQHLPCTAKDIAQIVYWIYLALCYGVKSSQMLDALVKIRPEKMMGPKNITDWMEMAAEDVAYDVPESRKNLSRTFYLVHLLLNNGLTPRALWDQLVPLTPAPLTERGYPKWED